MYRARPVGTRDELLAEAAALEADADRIAEACAVLERHGRDTATIRERERGIREAAARVREIAAEIGGDVDVAVPDGLRSGVTHGNVQEMNAVERRELGVKKSRAVQEAREEPADALTVAANAKGFSLREYAKRLGIRPSSLVGYRRGDYRIPRRIAVRIERELGFAATQTNWPAGIKD